MRGIEGVAEKRAHEEVVLVELVLVHVDIVRVHVERRYLCANTPTLRHALLQRRMNKMKKK